MRIFGLFLRVLGIGTIGVGILSAGAMMSTVSGPGGLVLGIGAAALGLGAGVLSLRAGGRVASQADRKQQVRRELSVVALAERRGGVVTVTDVVRGLGITYEEADQLLSSMADGSRISAEVTTEGIVRYVFRELRQTNETPRVRVPASTEDPLEVSDDLAAEESENARANH